MTGHRIDVHAHFPIDLRRGVGSGEPWEGWDTPDALRHLDRFQIQRQLLSMPVLPVGRVARAVNDRFAHISTEAPGRFGAFATVPGDDLDVALAELRRALDELGLGGLGLCSNVAGRYLGDPWFEPLFAEAAQRGVPVFVHPALNPAAAPLALGRAPFLVEYPLDTFRSVVDAVYAGVFRRHPGLRMIVAHCGGALPALAWRVTSLADLAVPSGHGPSREEVHDALSRLYLDTALSGSPDVLHAAAHLVGADRLLYGTDSGAAPDDVIAANDEGLALAGFSPEERAGVERHNAQALFGH